MGITDVPAVRRAPAWTSGGDLDAIVGREWLVTNGLGGYASGTIAGVVTRRYHGLLVAALPNPFGRTMMLNKLLEHVALPGGETMQLGGEELAGGKLNVPAASSLADFHLDMGLPVWRYSANGIELEKRVAMIHGQNTVHVTYRLTGGKGPVRLELRPAVHFRSHSAPVDLPHAEQYELVSAGDHYLLSGGDDMQPLRLWMPGGEHELTLDGRFIGDLLYRVEEQRGYESSGSLWSPGSFSVMLSADSPVTLVASTEDEDVMRALDPDQAGRAERERRRRLLDSAHPSLQDGTGAELVLAADQFIITPAGRVTDAARAAAVGDDVRTVIAGYHWFTDWGRDTMISLEGLTLTTGREREAGFILRTFAHYVRDGLIPNMFPDGSNEGLYHTADATLWFFQAVHRYMERTNDVATLELLLPTLRGIVQRHQAGTLFGIGIDPDDGLLRQGEEGYQLTWMDAKVDDWVVTPRRGKAVELNALWYNALSLLAGWVRDDDPAGAAELEGEAARARESFNERFWYAEGGYLYDIVDGEDGNSTDCRPNQLFAISLPRPVLERSRWRSVVDVVERELLTPVGLRSLAPDSPDYKPRYYGDLRTRDAAYHQGTVWGWLIGPWIDAWLMVHDSEEERVQARNFLDGLVEHLDEFGVGTLAEIFDADDPFTPRGCIAQAWSVAEALRCWVKTAPGRDPGSGRSTP